MMKFITMSRRNVLSCEPSMKSERRSEDLLGPPPSATVSDLDRLCFRRSSRISSTTLSRNSRLSGSCASSLLFHMRPRRARPRSIFHHGLSQNLVVITACAVSKCCAKARRSTTRGASSSMVFQGRPKPISQKASRVSAKKRSCSSISWPGCTLLSTDTSRRACAWNMYTMLSLKLRRLKIDAATLRWCFQCSPSAAKMP
mmetsp:Transcript_55725/g.163678  ORF Transcript_55725/g.163678 Transcript_55725/m.163678 type:complete len:200 (-) Transcript_55725:286-885(-)